MFRPATRCSAYCRRHHLQFGTYAEYTSVPDAFLAHKPESLSWEEAAALPLVRPDCPPGARERRPFAAARSCSSPGGAGGVGHLAIQQAVGRGAQRDRHRLARPNHAWASELGAYLLDYDDLLTFPRAPPS